jgi:hypothetical protein
MISTSLYSLEESNTKIEECIISDKPFFISRIGDNISKVAVTHMLQRPYINQHVQLMQTHDGIYCNDIKDVDLYAQFYNRGVLNSTYIAGFDTLYADRQNIYLNKKAMTHALHFEVLEPFYSLEKGVDPWTHKLLGKKILIVHPFVDSFKTQIDSNFSFFKDTSLFKDGQEFLYYKTFNTLANNRIHKNWFETFNIMCKDIKKLDFDIAIVGCGGYGIPLCDFMYTILKKSAIYIGGGLQLLFGITGKRWVNHPIIKRESEREKSGWKRPNETETIKGNTMIEGGCYW